MTPLCTAQQTRPGAHAFGSWKSQSHPSSVHPNGSDPVQKPFRSGARQGSLRGTAQELEIAIERALILVDQEQRVAHASRTCRHIDR
jgi:hypothetical protein